MKALVYHGPRELAWEETDDAVVGPGDVRIAVKAVGICGSDVHGYLGLTGRRTPPMIMGHEFSGVIDAVGEKVTRWHVGDRVTVQPAQFCGKCEFCKKGLTNLCGSKRFYGAMDCNGAMAEHISVPEHLVYRLPDPVDFASGAMIEAAAVAYRGVKNAGDLTDRHVLVIGAGTIGLLVTAIARLKGAKRIYVSDLSDTRLEAAVKMGADVTLNPKSMDIRRVVMGETEGKGADIAIEAVGATPSVKQSIELLRTGGTAVWIGNSAKFVEVPMQEIVTRELNIRGTYIYSHEEFGEVLELVGNGGISFAPVISLQAKMSEGARWFAQLADSPGDLIKVILIPE
ncbi:MAG: galactitol-1-phosphate 5-dehydrogenase [Synergistaceae bacterium]|nr:galactitol-1-phosphate 5-dehydrogenase [Synergistaceae bacterium]